MKLSFFLKIGTTFACFQILGTWQRDRDLRKSLNKVSASVSPPSLINLGDIPSGPYDLFVSRI